MAERTKFTIRFQSDLDECARQWNKTRDPMYYTAWFEGVKLLASRIPSVSSEELRPADIRTLRKSGQKL